MARGKRVAYLLLVFLIAAPGGLAIAQTSLPTTAPEVLPTPSLSRSQDDARAIAALRASMSAAHNVSYVAQVQTIRWGPGGAIASIAKVEHLAPDQTHRIYLAPDDVYGDTV